MRSAASVCREQLAPSLDDNPQHRVVPCICSCARLSASTSRRQEETACHLGHLARRGRCSASHARAVGWTRHTAGSTFTWRSRGAHCVGGGAVLALGQDSGSAPGQLMSQEARARRVRLPRPPLQKRAREADHRLGTAPHRAAAPEKRSGARGAIHQRGHGPTALLPDDEAANWRGEKKGHHCTAVILAWRRG